MTRQSLSHHFSEIWTLSRIRFASALSQVESSSAEVTGAQVRDLDAGERSGGQGLFRAHPAMARFHDVGTNLLLTERSDATRTGLAFLLRTERSRSFSLHTSQKASEPEMKRSDASHERTVFFSNHDLFGTRLSLPPDWRSVQTGQLRGLRPGTRGRASRALVW